MDVNELNLAMKDFLNLRFWVEKHQSNILVTKRELSFILAEKLKKCDELKSFCWIGEKTSSFGEIFGHKGIVAKYCF